MNRTAPSIEELKETVEGICKHDSKVLELLEDNNLIESLSKGYLKLCELAREKKRDFFGLRDFYSLIKMIYWHIKNELDKSGKLREFFNQNKFFKTTVNAC